TLPELLQGRGWQEGPSRHVADAVGAHHGFRATGDHLEDAKRSKNCGRDIWVEVRRELFDAVLAILGVDDMPPRPRLSNAAFERIAGLTSFADWIGSSLDHAQLHGELHEYFVAELVFATDR